MCGGDESWKKLVDDGWPASSRMLLLVIQVSTRSTYLYPGKEGLKNTPGVIRRSPCPLPVGDVYWQAPGLRTILPSSDKVKKIEKPARAPDLQGVLCLGSEVGITRLRTCTLGTRYYYEYP